MCTDAKTRLTCSGQLWKFLLHKSIEKWWQGAGAGAVCSDHSEGEDEAALCSAPSSSTNPVFSP